MKKMLYFGKYRLAFSTGRNSYFFVKIKIVFTAFYKGKINLRKIWNAIICNLSFYFKTQKSGKSPIIVSVDLWNECNENCVFCRGSDGKIYDLNPQINGLPVCFISAKKKLGISSLFKLVVNQNLIWKKRISTGKLNNWINGLVKKTPPPLHKGRSVKFKYIAQVNTAPPKFNIFVCATNTKIIAIK